MTKALIKQLEKTKYRCAMKEDGAPFLTRDTSDKTLTYLSVSAFLNELEKRGLTISAKTLKISKKTQKKEQKEEGKEDNSINPPPPVPSPESEEVANDITEEVEEEMSLPTFEEMMKMKYNDLKSFADDNDVDFPSAIKKTELQDLVKAKLYSEE